MMQVSVRYERKLVLSAVSVSGDVPQGFSWWRNEWPVEKLFLDFQNARFQDIPWWVGQIPPSSGTHSNGDHDS
jgi:hypothetical protein